MNLSRTPAAGAIGGILALLAIASLALGTGCASITYQRDLTFAPVARADVESLHPGESDLGEVLSRLGAPIYVWEGESGEVVVAYGAQREQGWSFEIKIPVYEYIFAPLRYDDAAEKLEGFVIVFDSNLKLRYLCSGLLRNLHKKWVRRPAPADLSSQPVEEPAPR